MYILTIQCDDRPGIVAAVAGLLHKHGCNIEESAQFHDPHSEQFFMRVVFAAPSEKEKDSFAQEFSNSADEFSMHWNIYDRAQPVKTLLLVSKADHCLNDILYRVRTGNLPIDITAIASNHEDHRDYAEQRNYRYEHLPITPETKPQQEQSIKSLIKETDSELIVLARYMQVLSDDFCRNYPGRVINIHHSFLPGFKGAKPYHQAYERGVKIIGATAHFVTPDLDEGPIIDQDTIRISHSDTPQDLQMLGQDTESRVLARALKLYAQRRIFLHGDRTVIL